MTTTTGPRSRRPGVGRLAATALTWCYAAVLIAPLYYLLITAFKDNTAIFTHPFALPASWSPHRFADAFDQADLGRGILNSVAVTVGAETLTLLLAVPAAFALARSRGRLGVLIERAFVLGFLIPAFAALVPTVLLAIRLQLFQTRTFLVLFLPATALPLSVILLTQFMRTIPPALEESANMDGAGPLTVLLRLYLPLSLPGIVTVLILNFLTFWNEYLFALVLGGPQNEVRTVQVALPTLVGQNNTQYGILAAGSIIAVVPVYVLYVLLNRRMQRALVDGAVKG